MTAADTPAAEEDYPDVSGYEAARREDLGRPPGFRMWGETFVCEPVLRAGTLLDLPVRSRTDGPLEGLYGFLRDTLTQDSWQRFGDLLADRERPVSQTMLDEAVAVVLEQYAGRPTQESTSSAATPSKRGKSSKVGSSSRARELRSA